MFKKIIATENSYTTAFLRISLGLVMFPHGAQKALGWFGGYGFEGTMGFFTGQMGIPWLFAFLAIAAEFAGSLGLVTGLLSRVAAFGIASVMAVAVLTSHLGNGFFMNWMGNQKGEGFEYHILAIALAVAVIVRGSGPLSLDRKLTSSLKS